MCEDSVHVPNLRNARAEVCTVLHVGLQLPGIPHDNYTLRFKIDTEAMGSTQPLRTFKQMHEKRANCNEVLT